MTLYKPISVKKYNKMKDKGMFIESTTKNIFGFTLVEGKNGENYFTHLSHAQREIVSGRASFQDNLKPKKNLGGKLEWRQ